MNAKFFVAILGAALSLATGAAPAQILTYGSGAPERANFHEKGVKPMMGAITEATGGKVKFRGLYGGTVVKLDTTLQGIRDGIVDSGYLITSFHPAELPHVGMLGEMSALASDPFAAAGAANEFLFKHCEACREDLAKQGQEAVFMWATSPMSMVCAGNMSEASDLRDRRVSIIGSGDARWASALGMAPTRTAISDLASSLQLGRSDCAIVPINWIRSYGLTDIAKTVFTMPQGIGAGAIPLAVRAETWAKLPPEHRQAIQAAVAQGLYSWIEGAYLDADKEVREQTGDRIRYIDEDAAMTKAWEAHQQQEIQALIELAKRRGIAEPEKFVNDAAAVFRKWHDEHLPRFAGKPEVYAEILQKELFGQ